MQFFNYQQLTQGGAIPMSHTREANTTPGVFSDKLRDVQFIYLLFEKK